MSTGRIDDWSGISRVFESFARMHDEAMRRHQKSVQLNLIKYNNAKCQARAEESTPHTWSSFWFPGCSFSVLRWSCKKRFLARKIGEMASWIDSMCANQTTTDSLIFYSILQHTRGFPSGTSKKVFPASRRSRLWVSITQFDMAKRTFEPHTSPLKRKIYSLTCAYVNLSLKSTCNVDILIPFLQSALCVRLQCVGYLIDASVVPCAHIVDK